MKYILFSPIGTTDPITNFRDGSMIHICRKYKPSKVYLYLSSEMLKFHQLDNRYCRCLEWLQKKEQFYCDIVIIERPELVDVQLFDVFYDDFESEVKKIREENADATILFNVSSGTPAMKSALQFLAASSENMYIPVQVSTPQKAANREKHDFEKYDVELRWELNEDNLATYEDRCIESETAILNKRIKLEVIRRHILAYDYEAALHVAQSIEKLLPQKMLYLLQGAANRFRLNLNEAQVAFSKANEVILPAFSSDRREMMEYILWLQVKQQRGDLADFIRGLSPVFVELFLLALKEKCHLDFKRYCKKDREGVLRVQSRELKEESPELFDYLEHKYPGGLGAGPLNADVLVKSLAYICKDPQIVQMAEQLREIEKKARNTAAHVIVSVTEEWLLEKVNFKSKDIMAFIRKFTQQICSGIKIEVWQSYNMMNDVIIAELDQSERKG